MSVATEHARVDAMFSRLDEIEGVAESLPRDDPRRATLWQVVMSELASADPIRPSIAAELLSLNEKTVRTWVDEGVLTAATKRPRVLLDATRVHEVLLLVRDLREAGKTRGLLDEVFRRLSDAALLERDDLQESLAQMSRREGTVVRELADHA